MTFAQVSAPSDADDLALLGRIGAGKDVDALAQLFERHAGRFLGALRKRGFSAADAEDIVQDWFLKMMNAGPLLARVTQPRAYLWRMLLNAASDHIGKSRRFEPLDPCNPDDAPSKAVVDALSTHEAPDVRIDVDRCVDRAWERLLASAPERAQALEWVIVDELGGSEIAELLHRSYGATREYLSQCRRVFRDLLREVCPDWTEETV